jgi:hypothetical protein
MGGLSSEEIHGAGKVVSNFAEEIITIKAGHQLKASRKIINLRPIVVDGILRVGGRLEKAVTLSPNNFVPGPPGNCLNLATLS